MLLTYEVEREFRRQCRETPKFDYWMGYDDMTTNDDTYNQELFDRVELELLDWINKNSIGKVF